MDIKTQLKQAIKNSIKSDIEIETIEIEIPANKQNGNYSSNIAMKLAKKLKKTPFEIASEIKNNIDMALLEKIEIAGPGFINFYTKKNYLLENINKVLTEKEEYGKSTIGNNKKIDVEFVSVNPTGIIHLGHTRGAVYGDSLSNILDFCGYQVTREYYINDAGNQINNMAKSIYERYKAICGLECNMQENYYYGHEIIAVAQNIYNEHQDKYLNKDIKTFKKIGLDCFLNQIKVDLEEAKVHFDVWSSEQAIRDKGTVDRAIQQLTDMNYTYEKDNAIFLKTSDFGDEKDRVIIKEDGSYTYFAPDIAYHLDKLNRGFDELVDVLGADHHGYIARLKAAVTMLGGDASKLTVPIAQIVRAIKNGEEYKISKRTGKTITMHDIITDVGVDAVRYFFVAKSLDTQIDFDIDLALKKTNENPVYYIQYAHARICSILKTYNNEKMKIPHNFKTINSDDAYNVLEKVYSFKEIVEKSAIKKEPHMVATYAYELAGLFHTYYSKEKIITDNKEETEERIMLISAVKNTIANALKLIGVEALEKM